MDLIRRILVELGKTPNVEPSNFKELERSLEEAGYSQEVFYQHLGLLKDAGFVEMLAELQPQGFSYRIYRPQRLTYSGYDFLEAIRDEGIFNKAKEVASEQTGGLVTTILRDLAIKFARQAAGLE
jgi:DNA-binding transcriptional ArsR family regulator